METITLTREFAERRYPLEVEYELEAPEDATLSSPPYPLNVLIYAAELAAKKTGGYVDTVDVLPLLDSHQLAVLKGEIVERVTDNARYFPKAYLSRIVKRVSREEEEAA